MDGTSYAKLEEEFAVFAGYSYGVAVNNGTNALTLALASLGVGEGDEVIVPEFTMVACAWAVSYLGATPVFVDCGDDLNIDPELIPRAITTKTKAIMPVHIYGRPCDMTKIRAIADMFGLYVVEDRAEIHGVSFNDSVKGDVACYSLYKNKIISSQEGGVLVTDDKRIKRIADDLKNMSFGKHHNYFHARIGWNMRMPEIIAEIALESLSGIEEAMKGRREWEKACNEALNGIEEVALLGERRSVWVYDFMCRDRDQLIEYVKGKGGQIRHFFKPMSAQGMYRGDFASTKAWKYSQFGAYIPYKEDKTIDLIKEFYAQKRQTTDKTNPPSYRPRRGGNGNKKGARGQTQGKGVGKG